jgi:hypothetical protein
MTSYRALTARLTLAVALAVTGLAVTQAPAATAAGDPDLGPNVKVFDPSMPTSAIQAAVDAVYDQQVNNEMGSQRYALLFKPGSYGTVANPLIVKVGYYTEVAGLGRDPDDVTINGHVDVYNRCLDNNGTSNCLALNNFWRSLSNLTVNVQGAGLDGCRASADFWAASQAAPMRRVDLTGANLTLFDYCTAGPQFASGGFIADSRLATDNGHVVINGSQQQYVVRDSTVGTWTNGVWNQVFAGVEGAPAQNFPPSAANGNPYTTLPTDPASREKPYLYVGDDGTWNVFVPDARTDSRGTTWADGHTPGHSVPLTDFYVARPGDAAKSLDSQLARGKNVLLTPGVYDTAGSLHVRRSDTVVLGLGLATLTATDGAVPIRDGDVKGVSLAGLTIDAGPTNSPLLMQIGTGRPGVTHTSAADPTTLSDVFFRIGGPHVGNATVSLEVNSNHVILDDIWAWRADHGSPGSVGWDVNRARNGVIVNGDDVTATGLFVEHYQQYNVIWNGERGRTVFFQNELPYDAPNQAAWSHQGEPGWAAYKVADNVRTHELWGGGSYIFTNVDPTLHAARGFEVPVTPGVRLHDLLTVSLNNAGTIDHVVNDTGGPVQPSPNGSTTSYVGSYP